MQLSSDLWDSGIVISTQEERCRPPENWRREMSESEAELTSPSLVSIIVPAFNEEGNIPQCVEKMSNEMRKAGYQSEIIVVNDGSTDKTLSVGRSLQRD